MKNFLLSQYQQIKKGGVETLVLKIITLFKFFFLYLLSIIFLPINFIILIISKIVFLRFAEIPTNRMGHFALEVDIYLTAKNKKSMENQKVIDIFCRQFWDSYVCNQELYNSFNKLLNIFHPFLIYPIIFNCQHYKIFSKHTLKLGKSDDRDVSNIIYSSPINLKFSNSEEEKGEKYLEQYKKNHKNFKFVTLIIRDKVYLKKTFKKDYSYHDYRNGNIQDYDTACHALTQMGYHVFRMGSHVEKNFQTNNPMIVDYATNGDRSEFLDIYLASKCEFTISNSTGWDALPQIFRKPILFIDYAPVGLISTFSPKFMVTIRHHYSKKLMRNLTLKEIFDYNLGFADKSNDYDINNVVLKSNTKEEIKNTILEMETFVKNSEFNNINHSDSNLKFWTIYKAMLKKYNSLELHGNIQARISSKFIENNKYLIK